MSNDFLLSPKPGLGGALHIGNSSSEKLASELNKAASTTSEPSFESEPTTTPRTDALMISQAVELASNATYEISKLRDKQLELAEDVQNFNDDENISNFSNEYNDIQTEIERISGSAVYNGLNVVETGATLSVIDTQANISQTVGLPSYSSLNDTTAGISSKTLATRAESQLEDIIPRNYGATGNLDQTLERINTVVDDFGSLGAQSPDPNRKDLRDSDDAVKLSTQVAARITGSDNALTYSSGIGDKIITSASTDSPLKAHSFEPSKATDILKLLTS